MTADIGAITAWLSSPSEAVWSVPVGWDHPHHGWRYGSRYHGTTRVGLRANIRRNRSAILACAMQTRGVMMAQSDRVRRDMRRSTFACRCTSSWPAQSSKGSGDCDRNR